MSKSEMERSSRGHAGLQICTMSKGVIKQVLPHQQILLSEELNLMAAEIVLQHGRGGDS